MSSVALEEVCKVIPTEAQRIQIFNKALSQARRVERFQLSLSVYVCELWEVLDTYCIKARACNFLKTFYIYHFYILYFRNKQHNSSQCAEVLSKPPVTKAHRTAWQL